MIDTCPGCGSPRVVPGKYEAWVCVACGNSELAYLRAKARTRKRRTMQSLRDGLQFVVFVGLTGLGIAKVNAEPTLSPMLIACVIMCGMVAVVSGIVCLLRQ